MEHIGFEAQIYRTRFACPLCGLYIEPSDEDGGTLITECKTKSEVYEGCKKKVVIWQ